MPHTRPVQHAVDRPAELPPVQRPSDLVGENETVVFPHLAGSEALLELALAVHLQCGHNATRQSKWSFRSWGFGFTHADLPALLLERDRDIEKAGGQVDLRPLESHQFARTKALHESGDEQCLQPIAASRFK